MITAMSPLPYWVPASWMPSSVRKVTDVPGTEVAVEILVEVGVMVGVEGLSVAVGGMAESHPDKSDKTSREQMIIL